jgi:predicted RNase H-like HicB family nuclease
MKYRAMIKQSGEWWIGWLVDLPGVNAQERTRERLMESLRSGAQDMLETEVPFEAEAVMTTVVITTVEIPLPTWAFGPTVAA